MVSWALKEIQESRVKWGLRVFQDNQDYQQQTGYPDREASKGLSAPKENQVLEVHPEPLVLVGYLDQEEKGGSPERKATRVHRAFQD